LSAAGRVWKVMLDPVDDSRPYTITATLLAAPSHTIQLHDVLFGDVWLCVGQNKLHHSVAKVLAGLSSSLDMFITVRLCVICAQWMITCTVM